jgi:hypothetical protein
LSGLRVYQDLGDYFQMPTIWELGDSCSTLRHQERSRHSIF